MREPSFGTEGLHSAGLPKSGCHKSRLPGVLRPRGGSTGSPQWVSALCRALGLSSSRPRVRNEIGMLFQKQPPDGARARQLCRLRWYFGNLDSSSNTVFFLPPLLLKTRFQRCGEVVWTFALLMLSLHFCLGGSCREDGDAAFSRAWGP